MYFLSKSGVKSLTIYLLCFAALWYAVLLSGVHATVAGVLAAMMIQIRKTPGAPDAVDSPLHMLEHALAPWRAFLIVPLFGFANAGVRLQIGRALCRERVCPYVEVSVVSVSLKNINHHT